MTHERVAISSFAKLQSGFAFKSRDWQEEGVPVIRIKNVKSGRLEMEGCAYVSEEVASPAAAFRLSRGDLLLTMTGDVGERALVRSSEWMMLNQRVGRFSFLKGAEDQVDSIYFYYALAHPEVVGDIRRRAYGAAQPNISGAAVGEVEVYMPPLPTQQRIAAILSAYDDLIENNTRRIAILEEMARRLYEEWFVHFRFPGHETAEFDGDLPRGWEMLTLGEAAANFDRKRKPLSKMQRAERSGPYPYYGAAKVFDYIDDYIFDGRYLLLAEDGSVATPEGFPVLQFVSGKFWPNNHTHILQGVGRFSTEFLYLALSRHPIMAYVTGAAQPKITQTNMNRIPITAAPTAIHAQFDELVVPFTRQVEKLEKTNANLRAQRDLLLPKLVSGEIDVSEAEAGLEAAE